MPEFTTATAKEMAARSAQIRKERREAIQAEVEAALELTKLTDYVRQRLLRVRTQLDRLDRMMLTETDPQKLDRLASAQARLSEQERTLAMRPAPGSLRPRGTTTPTVTGY